MKAIFNGRVIAESDDVIRIEGNVYFPRSSVSPDALTTTRMFTPCYWKGMARYHHVRAGDRESRYAAWSYDHPFPWIKRIRSRIAFSEHVQVTE